MMLNTSQIKPDPNQPRRTFDAEKMASLESSMRESGFRKQYPIIVDANNVIVDGERRWRAARKVGIKSVPVEVMVDVPSWQRLIYQLQSEGAELDSIERNLAWVKLWELAQKTMTKNKLAKALGVNESTYTTVIKNYYDAQAILSKLSPQTRSRKPGQLPTTKVLASIQRANTSEPNKVIMAEKAVKEDWDETKAYEIRKAIEEKPLKAKSVLSHDYSGETWKMTLEVAKAGFTESEAREINEVGQKADEMYGQVQAFSDIIMYGLKMAAAMRQFDYKQVTPQKRIELHQKLQKFVPFATGYIGKLEAYMIDKGELKRNIKLIK